MSIESHGAVKTYVKGFGQSRLTGSVSSTESVLTAGFLLPARVSALRLRYGQARQFSPAAAAGRDSRDGHRKAAPDYG